MSSAPDPEARINEALKALADEHRFGGVSAEEYRARRRAILACWMPADARIWPAAGPAGPAAPRLAPGSQKRLWLAGVAIGLLLVAMVVYLAASARPSPLQAGAAIPSATGP